MPEDHPRYSSPSWHLLCNIGLGLAIALLVCLFPMPYGYYTLVRFVSTLFFGFMAYYFYRKENYFVCIVAAALALLFQPFLKVVLGRVVWNIVDVVVAIALILLWLKRKEY